MIKPEHIVRVKHFIAYGADRCKEPSSWIGIGSVFVAMGLHPSNEVLQSISLIGSGVCGLLALALKDA